MTAKTRIEINPPYGFVVVVASIIGSLLVGCGGTVSGTPATDSGPPAEDSSSSDSGTVVTPDSAAAADSGPDARTEPDASTPTGCQSCAECMGSAGSFSAQPLVSESETRHYYLHVPPGYTCTSPAPLLIDFHGTASGQESDNVEEYYALPEMNAVADKLGFIVARPRSRSMSETVAGMTDNIYQWDVNPGDVPLNIAFGDELVASLESRYRIDPTRVYASGFSNGTNMALRFLGDAKTPFAGYGSVEGGLFTYDGPAIPTHRSTRALRAFTRRPATATTSTTPRPALVSFLDGLSFPSSRLWLRQTDSGHELYGWDYEEIFQWLDQGKKPGPSGTLASGWSREASFTSTDGLLKAVQTSTGTVIATGTNGDFWQRSASGAWSQTGHLDSAIPVYHQSSSRRRVLGWRSASRGSSRRR